MRAQLHGIYSEELDLNRVLPADRYRSYFHAVMTVGPDNGPGEETFQVTVCTPAWLAEEASVRGPIVGRHLLIVEPMDANRAVRALRQNVEAAEGRTWAEVAEKVSRIGLWEFEDYQEHPGAE
ncbi:Imm8 family immunity protein [Curtobacterium sp. Curtsp57]|uniref:Imm8 family immunity protein n=1 Tax=Curtobacterium sp. Curtsp57 TaxID=3243047 RepID=UPI0039B3F349